MRDLTANLQFCFSLFRSVFEPAGFARPKAVLASLIAVWCRFLMTDPCIRPDLLKVSHARTGSGENFDYPISLRLVCFCRSIVNLAKPFFSHVFNEKARHLMTSKNLDCRHLERQCIVDCRICNHHQFQQPNSEFSHDCR